VKADEFYPRIIESVYQEPDARHREFCALHDQILGEYLDAVRRITPAQACQPGSDGRSIAQVVAHIAEWDRYLVLAAGEMLAGVQWPQMMRFTGYLDTDGEPHSFQSVDDFNAFQFQRYAAVPWDHIRQIAVDTALVLHTLMTHRSLLNTSLLEKGRPYDWRLPDGQVISVPIGWFLWQINLEHEGVDHACDLGIA